MSDGDGETDTATVTITVTDANEAPAFDPSTYDFSVAEDAATDDVVGTVMAGDEDTGDTLTYSITTGNTGSVFSIDSSGQITVAGDLDYETTSSYTLTVEVSDGDGETDTATVTITVTDANEAPAFDPSTYDFSVAEDAATDDVVGTVMAGDEDTGDTLAYSITTGNTGSVFSIDSSGQITVAGDLDYETTSSYTLTVEVSDGDGETDTATVTITVTDANDAPAFDPSTYDFSVAEDAATDDVVGTVMAGDEDTGDTLAYSITTGNTGSVFSIDSSGQITVAGDLDYETTSSYTLTVEVSDGDGETDTAMVTITVTDVNDAPSVEIADLVVSMEEGSSDPFSVTASNLMSTNSYSPQGYHRQRQHRLQ